jgi:hypothetical protein
MSNTNDLELMCNIASLPCSKELFVPIWHTVRQREKIGTIYVKMKDVLDLACPQYHQIDSPIIPAAPDVS